MAKITTRSQTRIDSFFTQGKPGRRTTCPKSIKPPSTVSLKSTPTRNDDLPIPQFIEYLLILKGDQSALDAFHVDPDTVSSNITTRVRRQLLASGRALLILTNAHCDDCQAPSAFLTACSECAGRCLTPCITQRPVAYATASIDGRVINASLRALDQFDQLALKKEFVRDGGDALFLFRFMAQRAAHDSVRGAALTCLKRAMQLWDQHHPTLIPTEASHVLCFAESVHAKLFLGGGLDEHRHGLRMALLQFRLSQVLAFDPAQEGPLMLPKEMCSSCFRRNLRSAESCSGCRRDLRPTVDYQSMFFALVWAGLFREIGVELHCSDGAITIEDVLRHMAQIRPYRSQEELGLGSFKAQCYFITHFLYVMSDWAGFRLDPLDFVEEAAFLVGNLANAIRFGDPEIVGEMVQCLRILGAGENDLAVQKGVAYLVQKEKTMGGKGNWVKASKTFYQRYHAAYCGLIGMNPMMIEPPRSLPDQWRSFL